MRYYDEERCLELKAAFWQIELLKLNPEYCCWGPYEDYMYKEGEGWDSRIIFKFWKDFGPWELNNFNECANFYFEINRESIECSICNGTGLNEATRKLSDSWYSFDKQDWKSYGANRRYNNAAWQYHLTEIEVESLVKAGRLNDLMDKWYTYDETLNKWAYRDDNLKTWIEINSAPIFPSPEVVNERTKTGMGHDAINQCIAVKARAEYLGVYGHCEHCGGKGNIFIESNASVSLILWMLHPRKGCSRGIEIKDIQQNDLKEVKEFLILAAKRNAERFSKITNL